MQPEVAAARVTRLSEERPRILALFGSVVLFGAERGNMEALSALKADILCLVSDEHWNTTVPPVLEARGFACYRVPYVRISRGLRWYDFLVGNLFRFVRANIAFLRAVRAYNPTHIHVYGQPFAANFLLGLTLVRTPLIYRIGDKPIVHNPFWRWLLQRIVSRVDHFVAISEFIARELDKLGVPRDRITVIYNAPPTRTRPPQPDRQPDHLQHILFIGQVTADKGVDRLIDAFRQIAPEFPDARLTVVGRISDWSGDDWARAVRDAIRGDTVLSDRVHFPGETEDIYEHLAPAAFLVVPSVVEEALSNVVGEAKAAARPSVIFPRGGLPELIRHGEDGFICRDTSVEALAQGLRYYLADPDRALQHGRAALQSLDRLGIDKFATRWRDVYDRTMPRRRMQT